MRTVIALLLGSGLALGLTSGTAGCSETFIRNQTFFVSGNVTAIFINATPYRAIFSFGSYNALDKTGPGPVALRQLRLEGLDTSASQTLTCRRNIAVGTQALIDRAVDTNADGDLANFDPDAFDIVVRFSDAAADSDAAGLPTVGTARGRDVLLGIDYVCSDQLIFTFVEDASAPGGFRIDYNVAQAEQQ